jgi:hypothetical protein
MPAWNLGLENVAIHPNSGGTCQHKQLYAERLRRFDLALLNA